MPVPRAFHDLGIRWKLFLGFFFLALSCLCLFFLVSTILSTRQNEAQALRSARHVFGQTRDYLQYKTESARNLLYMLATSSAVQDLFERRAEYYRAEIGRWPIDSQALDKIFYPTSINADISGIRFYMKYGLASIYRNDRIMPLAEACGARWYARFASNDRRIWWFADDGERGAEGLIHVVRGVFGSQNITELTGIIQFDIPERLLGATLGNALLTESSAALVTDAEGRLVSTAGATRPGRDLALWRKILERRTGDFAGASWDTVSVDGAAYLVGTQGIEHTDWILTLVIPYGDIVRMGARPIRQMLLVLLLIIPIALLFAYLVSRSITRRLQDLTTEMRQAVRGNFSVTLDPGGGDEIGQLTQSFNLMISEISSLIDERYRLGVEVKQLELRALQAQINPHFLYNTLDLIGWMAARHDAQEIRDLVGALSRFYRLSLGGGEDTVTVRDELEHARTYVQIQNMRYENAVSLSVEVPEEYQGCGILKLVIQPLVENAIFHGIMLRGDERGAIRIGAESAGDALVLSVSDDGVGMSPARLREILSGAGGTEERHGYGVRNIHQRLVLKYGAGYGLSFESREGRGTTVRIAVPAGREGG